MVVKPRSPNYPSVDLETAINLLSKLYEKVHKGEFLASDAASAWDSKSATGPVMRKIAALRQYGLLVGIVRGKNAENPRISRRGLTFVLRNQASREYQSELKEAALAPPLFNEIYNTLSDPSDGVLQHYLIVEKGFTDKGANLFVEVYRTTIQLANLNKKEDMSRLEYDESGKESESDVDETSPELPIDRKQSKMVKIPLSTVGEYALLLPEMTTAEWNLKVKLFCAYKDMVVKDEALSSDSTIIEPE